MIVHIMLNTVFTRPFIEFVLNEFEPTEHRFLVVGGADPADRPLPTSPQVHDGVRRFRPASSTAGLLRFLRTWTRDSDLVVLHSMFSPRVTGFLALDRQVCQRTCWVVWGADVHMYLDSQPQGARGKAYRWARTRAVRRMAFIVPLAPGDAEAVEHVYGTRKPWVLGTYVNAVSAPELDAVPRPASQDGRALRVLVGNAASPSNGHAEAFRALSRFADQPMEVLVPLSYGDPDYAESIRELGRSLFGTGFISLDEFLPTAEYAKLLGTVDVAVFNHERQEGLGNYFALAYLGVKIYCHPDNPTTRYLSETAGVPLFDIGELEETDFETFRDMPASLSASSRRAAAAFYDRTELRARWTRIFNRELGT